MKTTWNITPTHDAKWANEKRRKFETRFPNTHWTFYHAHGKYVFHPTWRSCADEFDSSNLELEILEMVFATGRYKGVTFVQMYDALAKTTTLPNILNVCLHLARWHGNDVTSIIGRTGEAMGLRRLK